ncbi:cell division protein FtsX [Krasilnikovia sp. M28-CT-15]|uniref:cell division protein FtsX n=1 Tax=Krasilnikovia sp. M28-CT-15 TaxID=3373540 RepID=UPI00387708E8
MSDPSYHSPADLPSPVGTPPGEHGVPSPRRRRLVLASVAMAGILVGASATIAILFATDRTGRAGNQYTVRVFLKKGITSEQQTAVESALSALPSAKRIEFRTREQALRELQEMYESQPQDKPITVDDMSESFTLTTSAGPFDCDAFIPVGQLPGVSEVNIAQLGGNGKPQALVKCVPSRR